MPNRTETATEEQAETELTELLAEYYRLAEPEMERGGDFLWQLSERFDSGKRLGWFVEHEGDICQLDPFGEDGPHPTHAAAMQRMADHLRAAIVRVRSWQRVRPGRFCATATWKRESGLPLRRHLMSAASDGHHLTPKVLRSRSVGSL